MPPTTRVRPPLRRVEAGDDRGLTVVEALVSFVILMIVSTASVTTIVSANATEDDSNTRVIAANLVQRDLQAARALRYPNYPAAFPLPNPDDPLAVPRKETIDGSVYEIRRSVTAKLGDGSTAPGICPASPNFTTRPYMIVTTTVAWSPKSNRNRVSASAEIAC